jgi:hypothetical protein
MEGMMTAFEWNRQDFATLYRDLVSYFFRPLTTYDGANEHNIAQCENRLRTKLPITLRTYYRLSGNLSDINCAHHRLIPLSKLATWHNMIPFYVECQDVILWCIQADSILLDPPVYQLLSDDELVVESEKVSHFLINMFVTQCVNGGLQHAAVAMIDDNIVNIISSTWSKIELIEPPYTEDHTIYYKGRVLAEIACTDDQHAQQLMIASEDRDEFESCVQTTPASWLLRTPR